jgi:hypothetical protein
MVQSHRNTCVPNLEMVNGFLLCSPISLLYTSSIHAVLVHCTHDPLSLPHFQMMSHLFRTLVGTGAITTFASVHILHCLLEVLLFYYFISNYKYFHTPILKYEWSIRKIGHLRHLHLMCPLLVWNNVFLTQLKPCR